jgi:threonine aldolase
LHSAADAERLGFEAGVLRPSGTQSNRAALMTHCQRGDEMIVGQNAHTYRYEAGGAAVLGSIQPQPLGHAPDGWIPLEKIAAAIKPDDLHFARTRLLALENTIGGKAVPLESCRQATELAHGYDSVSICLSKGLGAPVGSVLLGTRFHRARKARAHDARRRTAAGGVLAAAGLYALVHRVARLADNHANMVFVRVPDDRAAALAAFLRERGVIVLPHPSLRLVTHLHVDRA